MSVIDYATIAESRRGTLEIVPFGTLLYACCIAGGSVEIKLERSGIRKRVFIENGRPTECRSNLLHETLGHFLLRAGRVDETQLKRFTAEALKEKKRIGALLVERGVVDAMYLYKALLRNLAQKILECFTWTEGEFEVVPFGGRRRSSLAINVPKLVFRGLTKFAAQEHVENGLEGLHGRELGLQASPPVALSSIEFSPSQRRVIEQIRAHARTDEILAAPGLSRDETARILYALLTMGLIRAWDDCPAIAPPDEATTAPAHPISMQEPDLVAVDSSLADWDTTMVGGIWPVTRASEPTVSEPPTAHATEHALRNEIVSAYLALRERDAFELLGLDDDATPDAIRSAYVERCDRYAPSRFESEELAPVASMADELLRATVDAYGKLRTGEGRRAQVQARRREIEEPATPVIGPDLSIASQSVARQHARQGHERLRHGNFGAAGGLFALAADSDPDEPLYRIHLAYARFRESPGRFAEPALATMRRLGGVQATLYAAEISHSLGKLDEAEELFLRATRMWSEEPVAAPV